MRTLIAFVSGAVLGILLGVFVFTKHKTANFDSAQNECPPLPTSISQILLEPPEFHEEMPKNFETNMEGEVYLRWLPVDGAKSYRIIITAKNDRIVGTYKATKTESYLKNIPKAQDLKTVEYRVSLATVNVGDIAGPPGEKRPLVVKGDGPVIPPQIKTIKVE